MEMIPIQLVGMFQSVARIMGVTHEEAEAGLKEINFGLLRLSVEAAHAESQGIGLKDAVQQDAKFPLMHLLHIGLKDILTLDVPVEMVPLAVKARDYISQTVPVEDFQFELAKVACTTPRNSPERALARFLLFEAVRLILMVASHNDRPALAYADIGDTDLSQIAEEQVQTLIEAQAEVLENTYGPMRPLYMVIAAALSKLSKKLDVFAPGEIIPEYVKDMAELRADAERRLNQLPPQDELLMRNWAAPAFGEQSLSHEHLIKKHPLVFDGKISPDALNQRLSRARKRIRNDVATTPSKRCMTMFDVMTLQEDEQ